MSQRSRTSQIIAFETSLFDTMTPDFNIQPLKNQTQNRQRRKSFTRKGFSATYTNFCSSQVIQSTFFICQGFLAYVNEKLSDNLIFLQNLCYARFHLEISTRRSSPYRIVFGKDEAFFELAFSESMMFHAFIEEIRKVCICTDFDEKYKILKLTEENQKSTTYLIESTIDKTRFSAKIFNKKTIMDPKHFQHKVIFICQIFFLTTI